MKLDTWDLVCWLILTSTSACIIDTPRRWSFDPLNFWKCWKYVGNSTRWSHSCNGRLIENCRSIWPVIGTNTNTVSDFEGHYSCFQLPYLTSGNSARTVLAMMGVHMNEKVHVACNFDCLIETEGLLEVTGSRVYCMSYCIQRIGSAVCGLSNYVILQAFSSAIFSAVMQQLTRV